jgi:hypothetical protein
MEDRNRRARSPMESMARRQLEARRLSESSPIAGLGTYQVMRPSRGREVVGTRPPPPRPPRPPRLPNGSNAFGAIDERDDPFEIAPAEVAPPPVEDRTMVVAQRLYRAEIAPPPREHTRRTGWLLPMTLAVVISTILLTLALALR